MDRLRLSLGFPQTRRNCRDEPRKLEAYGVTRPASWCRSRSSLGIKGHTFDFLVGVNYWCLVPAFHIYSLFRNGCFNYSFRHMSHLHATLPALIHRVRSKPSLLEHPADLLLPSRSHCTIISRYSCNCISPSRKVDFQTLPSSVSVCLCGRMLQGPVEHPTASMNEPGTFTWEGSAPWWGIQRRQLYLDCNTEAPDALKNKKL